MSDAIIFGHESLVAGLANIVFLSQMGLNVVYESIASVININRRENRKYITNSSDQPSWSGARRN
jgi:hypothetical protein